MKFKGLSLSPEAICLCVAPSLVCPGITKFWDTAANCKVGCSVSLSKSQANVMCTPRGVIDSCTESVRYEDVFIVRN